MDTHSILSIHNKVITRNYRIALAQADGRNWVLRISNVQESDRGWYMCQINTDPMRYQEAYLEVVGKIIPSAIKYPVLYKLISNFSVTSQVYQVSHVLFYFSNYIYMIFDACNHS